MAELSKNDKLVIKRQRPSSIEQRHMDLLQADSNAVFASARHSGQPRRATAASASSCVSYDALPAVAVE